MLLTAYKISFFLSDFFYIAPFFLFLHFFFFFVFLFFCIPSLISAFRYKTTSRLLPNNKWAKRCIISQNLSKTRFNVSNPNWLTTFLQQKVYSCFFFVAWKHNSFRTIAQEVTRRKSPYKRIRLSFFLLSFFLFLFNERFFRKLLK